MRLSMALILQTRLAEIGLESGLTIFTRFSVCFGLYECTKAYFPDTTVSMRKHYGDTCSHLPFHSEWPYYTRVMDFVVSIW